MNTNWKLTVLSFCFIFAAAEVTAISDIARKADMSFMQFMVRSRDLSNADARSGMACFDYYVPLLNDITTEYEASYGACLNQAQIDKADVDNATTPQREQIESSANNACETLTRCTELKSSVDYFECYSNAGSNNAKVMYAISANASEELANVREQYRIIENLQYRCTNTSERVYVESTADTYEQLQSCLAGKSPVPTPTPEPTPAPTPGPTSTTTAPGTETTIAEDPTTADSDTTIDAATESNREIEQSPAKDIHQARAGRVADIMANLRNRVLHH